MPTSISTPISTRSRISSTRAIAPSILRRDVTNEGSSGGGSCSPPPPAARWASARLDMGGFYRKSLRGGRARVAQRADLRRQVGLAVVVLVDERLRRYAQRAFLLGREVL